MTKNITKRLTFRDWRDWDYIGYVIFKEIANCCNINNVNPLYSMIDKMIGQFEEKSGNKYLVLDDVNENKEV